jgi:hypothetical protein
MLNNLTNYSNLISNGKIRTLLDATDLFTIGVRDLNFIGNYQPALITSTNLANSIASLLPFPFTLTTTGTSGASTLIGTVLNIPNYAGGSLPAWFEYDATDLTIWNNGQGNIATNTSYGEKALKSNALGNQNTAIGFNVLLSNTTGINNTALGCNALYSNVTGQQNTAVGTFVLQYNTSGRRNTSVGVESLRNNASGQQNIAIGCFSLYSNTTGINNVASGYQSLVNNTSAVGNTGIGHQALAFTTTGSSNTVIGALGLYSNSTGADNTAIGYDTVSGNFSSSIILGRGATATASNQFVVGSPSYNAGTIATEALVLTESWTVKINGVNYKIPLQIA